jgi:hypothetical protein
MNRHTLHHHHVFLLFLSLFLVSSALSQEYIIIGWSEAGMHCANKDFSKIALMPPGNTVRAQVIHRIPEALPKAEIDGITVEYSIPNNTYSVGKTNFWTYAKTLFGLAQDLPANVGLSGKGLTGTMDTTGNSFVAVGIPVTPYPDSNLTTERPYQLIRLVAKVQATGAILATTEVVIPVSNEIGCVQSGCHSSESNILNAHESVTGFNKSGPVLCAQCHASAGVGLPGNGTVVSLSQAVHNKHKNRVGTATAIAACYKCHPGPATKCLRDVMSTNLTKPMICQDCHGTVANIASSISLGRRPWLDEPSCGDSSCHGGTFAEETGKMFKQSRGHGKLFCSACHGSPHAILPSREANDNIQSIRLQGIAAPMRDCRVCHALVIPVMGPHGIGFTATTVKDAGIPAETKLYQNYPNPFNPSTAIRFALARSSFVTLHVYDHLGRTVRTIAKDVREAGSWVEEWQGNDDSGHQVASGVYFCRLTVRGVDGGDAGFTSTVKMLLVR